MNIPAFAPLNRSPGINLYKPIDLPCGPGSPYSMPITVERPNHVSYRESTPGPLIDIPPMKAHKFSAFPSFVAPFHRTTKKHTEKRLARMVRTEHFLVFGSRRAQRHRSQRKTLQNHRLFLDFIRSYNKSNL